MRTATILADWHGYLHSNQLHQALRRYIWRFEHGTDPDDTQTLPDL